MPLYENDQDRYHEQQFVNYLLREYGFVATKLDMKYGVDFFVVDKEHRPSSWIEFKNRSRIFDSYMISVFKVWRGRSLAQTTGMKFNIAIEVDSKYYTVNVTENVLHESKIDIGGRTDRGVDGDVEPMYFIPWNMFVEI